ncbi:hypothetical protein C4K68_23610 [Pokkaliibacter plantistimulans]|uniref:Tetratricopeptide repeat protein n=1 Tax=Proteobacteria bacterium 228 TaxID=2083153 RepID=A0A2S5KJP2_9PROT|nr:hypothetical protein [Pokkaliibacter plantistimulans]PPC74962.1 hypothetical protein C4K68_23610 [Pokkaliibacter plantistimulans]
MSHTFLRRAIGLTLSLILLILSLYSLNQALSSVFRTVVEEHFSYWQTKSPDIESVTSVKEISNRALLLDARSAEGNDSAAYLELYLSALDTDTRDKNYSQALDYYRSATHVRVNWPYSWAGIAYIKALQGHHDQEFITARGNAERLGPWEPSVQLLLLEADLLSWTGLSVEEKQATGVLVSRLLKRQYERANSLLHYYRKDKAICGFLDYSDLSKVGCI